MSTKAEILERLADVADDELIAVPTIWTKSIAEDVYEYAEDEPVELSLEQWAAVIEDFENAEYYGDEEMVQSIKHILEGEEA
jgi:hypothetical protein